MKIYVNGSGYPTFVLPGITLYDPGDKYEIPMHRINGMFLPPGAK